MSVSGSIIFYGTQKPPQPREALRQLIAWSGAESYSTAIRSLREDRSWEEFQAEQEENALGEGEAAAPGEEAEDECFRPVQMPLSELPALYEEGGCLRIDLRGSSLVKSIQAAIARDIPREVWGDYLPAEMSLLCGFHDIFESAETPGGLYIARAFISVELFGYSTPRRGTKFEKMFAALPEVADLRRELARIIGPVGLFLEWSY